MGKNTKIQAQKLVEKWKNSFHRSDGWAVSVYERDGYFDCAALHSGPHFSEKIRAYFWFEDVPKSNVVYLKDYLVDKTKQKITTRLRGSGLLNNDSEEE